MTENERIKEVRKDQSLTLEKFGERIGVTKAALSKIENGSRGVTGIMRRSICREFGVSEKWLLTGDGKMYASAVTNALDEAMRRHQLTQKDRDLIEKFLELPPDVRSGLLEYIERVAAALQQMNEQEQIDREAQEIAWQLREEKEQADGSSASPDTGSDTKMA